MLYKIEVLKVGGIVLSLIRVFRLKSLGAKSVYISGLHTLFCLLYAWKYG